LEGIFETYSSFMRILKRRRELWSFGGGMFKDN
jgi:hypothetical protein